MTARNQFCHLFDIKEPIGTYKEGGNKFSLRLHLHFKQSAEDERSYQIILTDLNTESTTDIVSKSGISANKWVEYLIYLEEIQNETATFKREKFEEEVEKIIFKALSILCEIPFEAEDSRSQEQRKIDKLVQTLQEQIRKIFPGNQRQFPKLAYQNIDELPNIVEFDPTYQGPGKHVEGKAIIGLENFVKKNSDGDFLGTIYHEYMHSLRWVFVEKYRLCDDPNSEPGTVYQTSAVILVNQSQEDFLQFAYENYILYLLASPETINLGRTLPERYEKLNRDEYPRFEKFIKDNGLVPGVVHSIFRYVPSSFIEDEINAYTETLEAMNKKVFIMSNSKINSYNTQIAYYKGVLIKMQKYEKENNINRLGW
jgi:hypothetical protein